MSHQVQLSPAASHRPNCRPGPGRHAAEPPPAAADVRTPPARQDMCRTPPTLGDPICTGIFHTSAKDPGQARGPAGRTNPHGPATIPPSVRWQARFPAKKEATRGHHGAPGAPYYIPGHLGSDLPARLMTVINPRDTPELPALDLPDTRAAIRCRPAQRPCRASDSA